MKRSKIAPMRRGWTDLQRQEGITFLNWVESEQILHRGFESLAKALRATLVARVRTAIEARDLWRAAPEVLENCNDPNTYQMRQASTAYAWLHLLDRYVRTWLSLEHLLRCRLLPMGKHGVRVLDVGTGPGPSAFATHDFYVAMEGYAQMAQSPKWRQLPEITCMESEPTMNQIRGVLAEELALSGARRSVLALTGWLDDLSRFFPAQERKQYEQHMRSEYDEYYDCEREEWLAESVYTAQEANRAANAAHRYRLFTFSNFLTTCGAVSRFEENLRDILSDARPGAVLLAVGANGGDYPAIYEHLCSLAKAAGFGRRNDPVDVNSAHANLCGRLSEEVRWFYDYVKKLMGTGPAGVGISAAVQKELDSDEPMRFASSVVHAFRK